MRKGLLVAYLSLLAFFVVLVVVIDYVSLSEHERVHRQIFTYFGCHNITMRVSLFSGATTCFDPSHNVSIAEESLHAYNEIVAYNVTGLSLSIIVCTLFLFTAVFVLVMHFYEPPGEN